jgi:glyoxylase-like metal-dependent hydrolase (beta-lactamase superfamily II)
MKKIKLHINYAGFCYSKENHAISGGKNKNIKFHALWVLILHPDFGYILYDTGYTRRFYDATKRFPNNIYALITKVFVEEKDEIKHQLLSNNISPLDIKHIIISHFHADHIGGLKDFPNARIYSSKTAYEYFKKIPDIIAFSKGILKELVPEDIEQRIEFIEEKSKIHSNEYFDSTYDLFGDETMNLIPLPGHAPGQMGLMAESEKAKYLFIADACWLSKSFEENILPNKLTKLIIHSWADLKDTQNIIHEFFKKNPAVKIIPTHCFASTKHLVSDKINFDVL